MTKYDKWVERNVVDPYGKCSKYTEQMVKAFPELQRVRGFYVCPIWGNREHWWLKTPQGKIVDPTKDQFPSKGIAGEYKEWDESEKEPTGKCPNCGEYCHDDNYMCSPKCEKEYLAYINER